MKKTFIILGIVSGLILVGGGYFFYLKQKEIALNKCLHDTELKKEEDWRNTCYKISENAIKTNIKNQADFEKCEENAPPNLMIDFCKFDQKDPLDESFNPKCDLPSEKEQIINEVYRESRNECIKIYN